MKQIEPTKLIVIRHGETLWNLEGCQQGHLDGQLSEMGIKQAQAVADALADDHFDALYSSDLGRAVQTAQIIAKKIHLDIITDPRLRERHLGIMQTLTIAQFQEKYPEEYDLFKSGDPDYIIPDGESARQRYERCVACANELADRHSGQKIVIVAHGGTLGSFIINALSLSQAVPRRYSLFNASINTFTVADGSWKLDSWGDIHHLKNLSTLDDW